MFQLKVPIKLSLNIVVSSCFGKTLDENAAKHIETFKNNYIQLCSLTNKKLSVTPKVHTVFHHILDFCNKTDSIICCAGRNCADNCMKFGTKVLIDPRNFPAEFWKSRPMFRPSPHRRVYQNFNRNCVIWLKLGI